MYRPTKRFMHRVSTVVAIGLMLLPPQGASAAAGPAFSHAERKVTTAQGATFELRLLAAPARLPSAGGTVWIGGRGYNTAQGIFLAFCIIPDSVHVGAPDTYTTLPTPCLGGRQSTDGSARRITNTATGTPGVTIPYGPDGSFSTTLNIKPELGDGTVCDITVHCAIVTRADFTATGDRLYDQYIPVHFASTPSPE